jgi:membrane protein
VNLPPMAGSAFDPPPKDYGDLLDRIEGRSRVGGVLFRAWYRFVESRTTLLAAGTTYYLFVSALSLIAFAYGITAFLGADWLAGWLTDGLDSAFPGLIEPGQLTAEAISAHGSTVSIAGLLILGYAGSSSVYTANRALHLIYGAPRDARNYVLIRARTFVMMLVVGPIILISYIPSIVITDLGVPFREFFHIGSEGVVVALGIASTALSIVLNYAVIHLLLHRLGGIRPPRTAGFIGAASGALAMEVLKFASASIIGWSVGQSLYGKFAVPITILLMLYLQSMILFLSACLTAGVAERRDRTTTGP